MAQIIADRNEGRRNDAGIVAEEEAADTSGEGEGPYEDTR